MEVQETTFRAFHEALQCSSLPTLVGGPSRSRQLSHCAVRGFETLEGGSTVITDGTMYIPNHISLCCWEIRW